MRTCPDHESLDVGCLFCWDAQAPNPALWDAAYVMSRMEELGSDIRQGVLSGRYDIDSNTVNALGLILRAVGIKGTIVIRLPRSQQTLLGPDDHEREDGSIADADDNTVVHADGTVPTGSTASAWNLDGSDHDTTTSDTATSDTATSGAGADVTPSGSTSGSGVHDADDVEDRSLDLLFKLSSTDFKMLVESVIDPMCIVEMAIRGTTDELVRKAVLNERRTLAQVKRIRKALKAAARTETNELFTEVLADFERLWRYLKSYRLPKGIKASTLAQDGSPEHRVREMYQRMIEWRLIAKLAWLNLSSVGSGKTLAVLMTICRLVELRRAVTVQVVCEPGQIRTWRDQIAKHIDTSLLRVEIKVPYEDDRQPLTWDKRSQVRILLTHYDALGNGNAEERRKFWLDAEPDLVVFDEAHTVGDPVKAKRYAEWQQYASDSFVNGSIIHLMTATPVTTSPDNVWKLLSLWGRDYTRPAAKEPDSISWLRAVSAHIDLLGFSTRGIFDPQVPYTITKVALSAPAGALDEYRAERKAMRSVRGFSPLSLERMMLDWGKFDWLRQPGNVTPGTIIYTENIGDGILEDLVTLVKGLRHEGRKMTVRTYTGNDNAEVREKVLTDMQAGQVDVVIATEAIAAGVNGFQYCANRLIIVVSPWTATATDQLIGRIVRDGQTKPVEIIYPYVQMMDDDGTVCSHDEQMRMLRVTNRRSLSDLVVDGIAPDANQPDINDANEAMEKILADMRAADYPSSVLLQPPVPLRRDTADLNDDELAAEDLKEEQTLSEEERRRRRAIHADRVRLGHDLKVKTGVNRHRYLTQHPETHRLYMDYLANARQGQWVTPPELAAEVTKDLHPKRSRRSQRHLVADFGCGMGDFARMVDGHVEVINIDHVADSRATNVRVANFAERVPLDDEAVDQVTMALALWGPKSDVLGALGEAHRVLARNGFLVIVERQYALDSDPTKSLAGLRDDLAAAGFTIEHEYSKAYRRAEKNNPKRYVVIVARKGWV